MRMKKLFCLVCLPLLLFSSAPADENVSSGAAETQYETVLTERLLREGMPETNWIEAAAMLPNDTIC